MHPACNRWPQVGQAASSRRPPRKDCAAVEGTGAAADKGSWQTGQVSSGLGGERGANAGEPTPSLLPRRLGLPPLPLLELLLLLLLPLLLLLLLPLLLPP